MIKEILNNLYTFPLLMDFNVIFLRVNRNLIYKLILLLLF